MLNSPIKMRRVFRSKSGNSNSNSNRSSVSRNNSSNKLTGNKFIPSDDPPVLAGQPWNNIVIDTSFNIPSGNWSYFKISDLYKCLLNQCGFNGGSNIVFECRFLSVSLWAAETAQNASTMTYARLCVMVMDLIHDNSVELIRLESNAVRNKFAKVGYHYPLTVSSAPIKVGAKLETILIASQTNTECSGIMHMKVLWRGANAGFKAGIFVERWIRFDPPQPVQEEETIDKLSELSIEDVNILG